MPDSVVSLRNAENSAIAAKEPSYYTGSGRDSNNGGKSGKSPNLKGKKKGIGALITILLIFGGMGVFLGGSNSLLAPAMSALLTGASQTSYTSYVLRTKYITSNMLKGSGADAVNTTWTGKVKYSKIPNYMKKRLAKYDIEVTGSGKNTRLHWQGQEIDAEKFITMYNENPQFRDAYSKAKRGRVANFFDQSAEKLFKKLGLSRNWRANLKDTGDAETDAENLKKTLSSKFENDGKTTIGTDSKYKEIVYEDEIGTDGKPTGNKIPVEKDTQASSSATAGGNKASDMDAATSGTKSFLTNAAGTIAGLGNAACTFTKLANTVAVVVAANEIYQSINYFMGQLEGPSKMMAGYGDESGINSQLNNLTARAHSSIPDYDAMGILDFSSESSSNYANGEGIPQDEKDLAPIEAPILQSILGGSPVSAADASNYSLERSLKKIGGAFLFTTTTTGICAGIDALSNVISIASIFAGGVPAFVANFLVKTTSTLAFQIVATTVLGFLIPSIARSLFSNIYDTATGAVAGNLIAQGAYASGSREGRTNSGQSPTDKKSAEEHSRATNAVLALEAEQDRLNHSPFDITNRNTFFGSIAYNLLPTLISSNTTSIASFVRSTAKSLSSAISKVSADGEGSSYATTYGDCPVLETIGAVGDVFCNPITVTDMSTIAMDPDDDKFQDVLMEGVSNGPNLTCDAEGNCKIESDSNLAYYVSFCANRESPFGVVDQNILGSMQPGITSNPIVNSIPLVSDFVGLFNAGLDLTNIDWANGKKCSNTAENSEFWNNEGKYYQRYIEDQRILEQMGAYEGSKNPVIAYQEVYEAEYTKEHPESDTYLGYLSRISGLTVENTETVLALAYYYTFVDQYDPTNRIAMTGDTSDHKDGEEVAAKITQHQIKFENPDYIDSPIETNATHHKYIAYYDLRNRSYAV